MQCVKCGKKVYANETCVCGEKAPKKNNGGVRVNSVICFIILMISVLCLILTLSLRSVVNKNLLIKAIENVELSEIKIDDGKKLDKYIYDEYVDDERITVENVDNLLKDPFIKDFMIEKINAYQNFALDNGELPYITADEIVKLIEDNQQLLYNEAGLRFLEPDKAELKEDLSGLDDFERFSRDFLDTSFGTRLVQTFFSYVNVIFLSVLLAVILIQWIVVYKANSRRAAKMLVKYGIAVLIPSLLVLVSAITIKIVPDMEIVDKLVASAKTPFYIYSSVFAALGVLITILAMAANKKYQSKKMIREIETETLNTVMNEIPESNVSECAGIDKFEQKSDNDIEQTDKVGICPQCSHQNKEGAAFCSRCGTRLK